MAKGNYGNPEAVVLNPQAYTNFFLKQQQQKKLERQALDKQVSDDIAKLSPDGIRQPDVEPFLKQYQYLKNLSIQYKDAIRNPNKNPQVWQEYQNSKAKLMGLIAESKAAKENKKALIDFYGKNVDRVDTDKFRQSLADYDAPIGSPEYEKMKSFDPTDVLLKAPKTDLNKLFQPLNQLKPEENQEEIKLPSGETRKIRTKQVNPGLVANHMGLLYDSDQLNAKSFFDNEFNNTSEDRISKLEDYAQKNYDPDFVIKDARDLAIASGLYGRVNKNVISDLTGSDISRREAFQQRMQNQRLDRADLRAERTAARKDAKDSYIWENDIANAMTNCDTENVRRLASRLDTSHPGVEKVFLKEGQTTQGAMKTFMRELRERGLDGKTKNLKPADFKAGVLVVAVPKTDKEGKRIKNKNGLDEFEYLAVSSRDQYIQSRLNKLKSYAAGTSLKGLPDKAFKQQEAVVPTFEEDGYELDPTNEEEQ